MKAGYVKNSPDILRVLFQKKKKWRNISMVKWNVGKYSSVFSKWIISICEKLILITEGTSRPVSHSRQI